MSKESKVLTRPVLNMLACIGVAGVSALTAGGSFTLGVLGSSLMSIFSGIAGNIASDQLLKIDNKNLFRWWKRKGPDLSNHDLFFALQQSVIDALRAVEAQFVEQTFEQDKKQLREIRKKIDEICDEVQENFLGAFGDSLLEADIAYYGESKIDVSRSPLVRFFAEDTVKDLGGPFSLFFHAAFPNLLVQAFTEQLKTNKRAWVAYQRMILQELQEQLGKNLQLTEELNAKMDDLLKAFSMVSVMYETNNQGLAEFYMQQNEAVQACWQNAQDEFEQMIQDFKANHQAWVDEWRSQLSESLSLQHEALTRLDEIRADVQSLKKQQSGFLSPSEIDDLETRVLPVYLNWIRENFYNIKLPDIKEENDLPSIPLEQVYVALRLFNKKSEQELLFSSELINSKVESRIRQEGKEVTPEQIDHIRAEILQENPTLHAVKQMQTGSGTDQGQSMNLADAFKNFRYLVILGDPGSGKSTLSKWLMLKLVGGLFNYQTTRQDATPVAINEVEVVQQPEQAEGDTPPEAPRMIDLGPSRLPVLIRISDYFQFWENYTYNPATPDIGRGVIDFIGTALHIPKIPEIAHEDVRKLIQYYLKSSRAVIVLDGLDEVVSDRTSINNEIGDFVKNWVDLPNKLNRIAAKRAPGISGGNQVIVTSRIVGYHTTPLPNNFAKVFIEKMDDPALEHFCQVWTRQIVLQNEVGADEAPELRKELIAKLSKELQSAIFDPVRPQIRELATNPLLVTMLAMLFRYGDGQLPDTRVELYEKSVSILIEKWQLDRRHNLKPGDVKSLMQALAAHIHSSPSDDANEATLQKIFEQQLSLQAGCKPGDPVSPEIEEKARWVLSMIRSDVGLLSDRGGKLYHFLHRTFQEYLAGLYLIRDAARAPEEIIDRIADPIWREPIVLALGYANQYPRDEHQFGQLLKNILKGEDEIKDLVPRTILLVAIALPEMSRLSYADFKQITVAFLQAFGVQKNLSQTEAVQQQIKLVLAKLRSGRWKEHFFEVCADLLKEPEYGEAHWAVLNLAAFEGWGQLSWVDDLLEHLHLDNPDWNWPIDRVLKSILASMDFVLQPNDGLKFRNKVLQHPEWDRFIHENPAWMRLLTVLYGGWASDPESRVQKFTELEQLRYRFFEGAVNMENEGYSMAVRLDTEGGAVDAMYGGRLEFLIGSIHRDSPFTRILLKALSEEAAAESLIPAFLDIWQLEEDIERRALALLALSALGYNTAMVIYRQENDPADKPAIDRFLAHLQRVQHGLHAALIRFYLMMQQHPVVLGYFSFRRLPTLEKTVFTRIALETINRAGLPPLHISDRLPQKLSWYLGDSTEEMQVKNSIEVFAWIARTGSFTFDPVGEVRGMIEQHGESLAGPNASALLECLVSLPFNRMLCEPNNYTLHWQLPKLPFPHQNEKSKHLYALEVINGLPEKYQFLQEWMIRQIWPLVLEQAEVLPFACTVLLKLPNGPQVLQELLPDEFDSDQVLQKLEQLILDTPDPYSRFRAIDNLFPPDRSPALQKLYVSSFLAISSAEEWFIALDHLLSSRYLELHFPDGNVVQLPYIDLNTFLDVNAQKSLSAQIEEKLMQMDDDLDRAIFKLVFLKNLHEEDLQMQVFKIMDAVVEADQDLIRLVMLRMMLSRFGSIARKYPNWMKINAAFTQPELLNFALQKDYLTLFGIDHKMVPQSYEVEGDNGPETRTDPDARPQAVMLGVLRMAQQLSDRFSILDRIEHYSNQLLQAEHREAALSYFLTQTHSGLPLNRHWVAILDELVREGADETVQALLPLMDLELSSDLEIVAHWEKYSVDWLRHFYHLLQAEAGVMNQIVLKSLIQYLGEYPDRLRYRAANAMHGSDPGSAQMNRIFYTSKIEFEDLVALYAYRKTANIPPSCRTTLDWFNHNLVHNDMPTIRRLIDAVRDRPAKEDSWAEQLALRRLEFCTAEILEFLGNTIEQSEGLIAELLWKSLARMVYANSGHTRRIRLIHKAMKKGLATRAADALSGLRDHEINAATVAQALLKAGNEAAIPAEIIDIAKAALDNDTVIDPGQYREDPDKAIEELYRWGRLEYHFASDEQIAAQNFSQAIAGKPAIIKALLDWTLDALDDELINHQGQLHGASLSCLLAQVARDYPDTMESLFNRQKTVELLYECITEHSSFPVRLHCAVVLCRLRQVDPKTLNALVNALKDVQPVRDGVITELKHLSRIFNQATFDALKQLIFSPNGTVAQAATELLGAIARQSSFDIQLRKQTISVFARALRNQLNYPSGKCLIYNTPMLSIIPKPVFTGHLETVLYKELVALSGVTNEQAFKSNT